MRMNSALRPVARGGGDALDRVAVDRSVDLLSMSCRPRAADEPSSRTVQPPCLQYARGPGTSAPPLGLPRRLHALERLLQARLLLVRQRRPQYRALERLQLG